MRLLSELGLGLTLLPEVVAAVLAGQTDVDDPQLLESGHAGTSFRIHFLRQTFPVGFLSQRISLYCPLPPAPPLPLLDVLAVALHFQLEVHTNLRFVCQLGPGATPGLPALLLLDELEEGEVLALLEGAGAAVDHPFGESLLVLLLPGLAEEAVVLERVGLTAIKLLFAPAELLSAQSPLYRFVEPLAVEERLLQRLPQPAPTALHCRHRPAPPGGREGSSCLQRNELAVYHASFPLHLLPTPTHCPPHSYPTPSGLPSFLSIFAHASLLYKINGQRMNTIARPTKHPVRYYQSGASPSEVGGGAGGHGRDYFIVMSMMKTDRAVSVCQSMRPKRSDPAPNEESDS